MQSAAASHRHRAGPRLAVPGAADGVVRADVPEVAVRRERVFVELGRVLDLVLRAVDEDLLLVAVHLVDHAGRDHDLLAEDPRAGVDDDVRATDLRGRGIDLADAAVERFDVETDQILDVPLAVGVRPHLWCAHAFLLIDSMWGGEPDGSPPFPRLPRAPQPMNRTA